jgi:hypothetical protein
MFVVFTLIIELRIFNKGIATQRDRFGGFDLAEIVAEGCKN